MIEYTILSQLIHNTKFTRRVLPFLRSSYFGDRTEKILFKTYVTYFQEYNHPPSLSELAQEVSELTDIGDSEFDSLGKILDEELLPETLDFDWLVKKTEEWCQEKALNNAVMDSISIIDGEDKKRTKHAIPDLLKAALAITFDSKIGHDYLEDAEERFEFYNEEHERTPFDLEMFNKVTNGGVPNKTLNIILAGTNVGKTLGMIHKASAYMKQGKNVLYITMEMAEEQIANRIDANLMDMAIIDVERSSEKEFMGNIENFRKSYKGRLVIREYPTGAAHAGHFQQLIDELKLKKKFKPDVILVDYIGITASSRVQLGQVGSYFYVKAIAEELRALAVVNECILWTAVQVNRTGFSSSDPDVTDTAESFGLPATADFMVALIRSDELDALGQILVKQLKSRYGNKNYYNKFVIGIDPDKQQLFDVDMSAQQNVTQDVEPVKRVPQKRDMSKYKDIEV